MVRKINIGVLGIGSISARVFKGIQLACNANLYAVCSRSLEKARTCAKKYDVNVYYHSYTDMLSDPNVDLIYILTPNYLHKSHILLALSYGKHVMCEKPMCLDVFELQDCFALAKKKGLFLMEAHKTVFNPLNQRVLSILSTGRIGNVHTIEAQYASVISSFSELPDWHLSKRGSGCLYDIGVYPIAYANFMAGNKLKKVIVHDQKHKSGFVTQAHILVEYENGIQAHLATSWLTSMENTAYIYGDKGYIKTKNFWKNTEAEIVIGNDREVLVVEMGSDFTPEIEHACDCILNHVTESPIMSEAASKSILDVFVR